jgi:hypothetical protein
MLILRLKACDRYPLGRSRSHVVPAGVATELAQLRAQLGPEEKIEGCVESGNRQLDLHVARSAISVRNQQSGAWMVVSGDAELRDRVAALAVFA